MKYKPDAQGLYKATSSDGRGHILNVVNSQPYRFVTECIGCKWSTYFYIRATGKTELTQARLRDWYEHIEHYELVMGLTYVPLPTWMGSWESPRLKGEMFIYRFDANLPQPLRGEWDGFSDSLVIAREALMNKWEWTSPYAAYRPWMIVESSGSKKEDIYSRHVLITRTGKIAEAQRVVHKHLSKRRDRGETVVFPMTEIPQGLEVPLPPIDKFVEGMAKIAQTNNYGQIHRALEQVQRGIIQLELLKEIEASLLSKLSIEL